MSTKRRVSEKDLHAYLDGELSPERAATIEAHLRENEEDARRLAAYRADGEAIRRIFSFTVGRREEERETDADADQPAKRRIAAEV
jgi:anti-sigma factor RsiW